MQVPIKLSNKAPGSSTLKVIWGSGASVTASPHQSGFTGGRCKLPTSLKLASLAKGLSAAGQGHAAWGTHDVEGVLRIVKAPACRAPGHTAHLLSTASLPQTHPGEKITLGKVGNPAHGSITALTDGTNNLPTSEACACGDTSTPAQASQAAVATASTENHSLSELQKELLCWKELLHWHYRLGHLGHLELRKAQAIVRSGA